MSFGAPRMRHSQLDAAMAFGKRRILPAGSERRTAHVDASVPVAGRVELLRDQILDVMMGAGRIADAIRNQTTVAMPVITEEPDPESGPLSLKGFTAHFIETSGAGLSHPMYAYGSPSRKGPIDPNAQYHLQQLTGQVLAFNLFCQRAELDEALGVALQAPTVPDIVDSILIRSAFFVAFFDNLIALAAMPGATPDERTMAAQRFNLDRHLLMAKDMMLAPDRADTLVPLKGWPFIGVELPVEPHTGDYFINGVYFPADSARLLLSAPAPG